MSEEIKKGLLGIVVDETTISHVVPELSALSSGTTWDIVVSSTTIPSNPFLISSLIIHVPL